MNPCLTAANNTTSGPYPANLIFPDLRSSIASISSRRALPSKFAAINQLIPEDETFCGKLCHTHLTA